MSNKSVIRKIKELPPEALEQADRFVEYLYVRYVNKEHEEESTKPITESPFIGMWKNREDMADCTEWVRKQRNEQ